MSSSWDEQRRQKPLDKGTGAPAKQVKPAGVVRSVEASPARDNGKSDVGVWEAVFERENMQIALKRVESNKGAAGIDGMEVSELRGYLKEHWLEVREALESGKYRPSPVRRVEIPKPDGGVRQLGIPTVLDRLIQQAIAQVLTPMFEAGVLSRQLRVSTRTQCPSGGAASPGVHRRRQRMGSGHRHWRSSSTA